MAYAAVISLKHTIQRLENPINKPRITKSANEELNSLRFMLEELDDESSRNIDRSVINELDAKIRDEVWKLEDVIESSYSLNISSSQGLDEKGVEQEMNSFLKKVKMLREEYNRVLQQNRLPEEVEALSEEEEVEDEALPGEEEDEGAAVPRVNKSTTVGFSDLSQIIINQLLHRNADLKAVALVGMAGIGKTHLATDIYHHPLIVQHFESRVWVRVGPKYIIGKKFFADVYSQIERKPRYLFKEKSKNNLKGLIQNNLRTRRFLVVLDDIWSTEVLDYFTMFFPDCGNRCRFLLTTRLQKVAKPSRGTMIGYGEFGIIIDHMMPLLNNEESWNLLWQNVFVAEKSFPSQLEKPGRKIAENCEGLPLLILAVANILHGLDKTEEYWKKVAEKKTTTFTDAYDQIYEVLLPSYEYLPQHLKACFLYMGVFPQTCEIPLSKLINLWDIEDFLEPRPDQKLEEFAVKYMEDLLLNSVAILCKQSFESVRRIKSSKLHSTFWHLCVKEARKNKLFHVLNKLTDVISIENPRRVSVQNNILLGLEEVYESMAAVTSTTRSLLCTGEDHQYPVRKCLNMMLLKVLDALAIRFYEFPNEVLKLLRLRYLSLTHNGELPCSISKLQQLQCLILRRHHNIKLPTALASCLPEEIWDMQELRHVRIMGSNLPDPSKGANLPKLATLYVNANSCSEDVFKSIPNLKKLGIAIELQPDAAETISCLEHIRVLNGLESLKCVVVNPRLRSQSVVSLANDLSNWRWWRLKKMSLEGLGLSWNYMGAVGSLYCLEVLKLRCSAFQGAEWKTKAGKFQSLKYLLLEDIDLVHWTAEDKCFPRLRHLSVRHCYKLKKIPCEIGDIPILKMMEVDDCSPSVVYSAQQLKEKATNSHVEVLINSSCYLGSFDQEQIINEKKQEEKMVSSNTSRRPRVCCCGLPSVMRTSTEPHNKGRKFICCPESIKGKGCGLFEYEDDAHLSMLY